jgi:hypothetical protein
LAQSLYTSCLRGPIDLVSLLPGRERYLGFAVPIAQPPRGNETAAAPKAIRNGLIEGGVDEGLIDVIA